MEQETVKTFISFIMWGMTKCTKQNAERSIRSLQNQRVSAIVGLNDMFSDAYHAKVKNRQIDLKVNETFKNIRKNIIQQKKFDKIMTSHFAIMEVEAWFLGMYDYLQKINSQLTPELIKTRLGTDITQDPEITVYHPAKLLNDLDSTNKCNSI